MLHLALAALLAGSFGTGEVLDNPDRDKDSPQQTEATIGIVKTSEAEAAEDAPVNLTYAFGRSAPTFLQVWAGYGWARVDEAYAPGGNEVPLGAEVTSQRAFVGAQVNFVRLPAFTFGVGGELAFGSRSIEGGPDSGFGTQGARVYGELRGRVLGLHGGYIFDLGDADADVPVSDLSDAFFIGASFDYPATWLRLFGGVDYINFQDTDVIAAPGQAAHEGTGWDSPAMLVFNMGAGVNISWVEIGVAALIRTNTVYDHFGSFGSGHQGSVAPYLNISPPALPVSLSLRGAFNDEYADYGFSLGGSRDLRTNTGFTAALTWGF